MSRIWKTSRREISLDRPLVMGILNVTPDSFSDGGEFATVEAAIRRAEQMIAEGVDIIDVGGESTRPGGRPVEAADEANRTLPVIAAITKRFETPVSIDTTKWQVARAAVDHGGAEIINDISGLRWEARLADVAASTGAGLVLMHSRGEFETMHSQPPVADIMTEVKDSLTASIATAKKWGVTDEQIVLDIGIGFGKTLEQNLELIAKLDRIKAEFPEFPMLVGASRKSFIGRLLGGPEPNQRDNGSLAAHGIAMWNGASIIRTHDIVGSIQAAKISKALLTCR